MLKKLILASVLFVGFGAQAAIKIETELQMPGREVIKDGVDIELSDRATLTLGDTDLHISIVQSTDSEQDSSKISIMIAVDIRDEQGVITSQGSTPVDTTWGAPVLFTLVSENDNQEGAITLTVTATQN